MSVWYFLAREGSRTSVTLHWTGVARQLVELYFELSWSRVWACLSNLCSDQQLAVAGDLEPMSPSLPHTFLDAARWL
jgi:hypothetical protein